MLHIIVATFSEANPIINYYKLKKNIRVSEFEIYENTRKKISLTISGVGKISSAIATCFTFFKYGQKKNSLWLNFGLAGNKELKIGEIVLVSKVTDYTNKQKTFFPFFLQDFKIKRKECITYDMPNNKYNRSLSDMESIGFFYSANKFSTKEFIFSLKIISDNEKEKIDFKSRKIVFDLIFEKIDKIDNFIKKLTNIKTTSLTEDYLNKSFKRFTKQYSFTFSQQVALKKLLKVYLSRKNIVLESFYNKYDNADCIIKNLKKFLNYEI
tara:strand:+ start:1735 stop:2538 length:804 start_codon:yes stop_codon:yes gene_type:complete